MSGRRGATTTTTTTSTPTPTTGSAKKTSLGSSPNNASACLRLQSDLRSIRVEPPEVRKGTRDDECVVSPEKKREEFLSRFWSSFLCGSARFSPFQAHLTLLLSFFCPTEPTNTNRAARHLRTRMITCSSGRRRFLARKTPRGKAGFFPYG